MAHRDRRGSQLALLLEPELLQRLKAHAAATERPVAALVRKWIEAGLDGALESGPAGATGGADLVARIEALEAAVAALQRSPRPPAAAKPAPSPKPLQIEALPLEASPPEQTDAPLGLSAPKPLPPALPAPVGVITSAELAERTATNRAAWNNWAAKASVGAVRHHPQAGSWRLVGKGPGPNGGPDRWLWEPA